MFYVCRPLSQPLLTCSYELLEGRQAFNVALARIIKLRHFLEQTDKPIQIPFN
jgi:hypothetical protein